LRQTKHGFILGKTARIICTGALLHQKVWPPSKGLCVPPEGAPTLLEGELASDIINIDCFDLICPREWTHALVLGQKLQFSCTCCDVTMVTRNASTSGDGTTGSTASGACGGTGKNIHAMPLETGIGMGGQSGAVEKATRANRRRT
jgi:hypothetical protein